MSRGTRRLLGALMAAALVGPLAVDALWTSDEELVEQALAAMESGLEAGDADAVLARFAGSAVARCSIPGFPRNLPLAEGLRAALARFTTIRLDRHETSLTFPEPDVAEVRTSGLGATEHAGFGRLPFRFEMRLRLCRNGEEGFFLESVEEVDVDPGIG